MRNTLGKYQIIADIFGAPIKDVKIGEDGALLNSVIDTLPKPQQITVLRLYYGLEDGTRRTLAQVGGIMGLSKERIRQIQAKGLRLLRHPSRSKELRAYLVEDAWEKGNQELEQALQVTLSPADYLTVVGMMRGELPIREVALATI